MDATAGSDAEAGQTDTGGDESQPPDAGATPEPSYGTPCPAGQRIGSFEVAHWDFYSAVAGEVAEGVIPLTVLQLVHEQGDCRLMRKENPFCDPPCGAGQLCDHDSTCIAYPANISVGEVTVSGLAKPITMQPKRNWRKSTLRRRSRWQRWNLCRPRLMSSRRR